MSYKVSLCIPTNGVIEWVFPCLDSILIQNANISDYQIVITDNGTNSNFKKEIKTYISKYSNIKYAETDSIGFLNQIDCFNLADAPFVKFINHRSIILPGFVDQLILFVEENIDTKPNVYFSNGNLRRLNYNSNLYNNFDDFVRNLSYYSSWSGGLAFWKEKYIEVYKQSNFNALFPHLDFLFYRTNDKQYIINNCKFMNVVDSDATKKGNYNLFYAFSVNYLNCLKKLVNERTITNKTYKKVKYDNSFFIAKLYADFCLLKKKCSYDLSDSKKYISANYSLLDIEVLAILHILFLKCKWLIKHILGISQMM